MDLINTIRNVGFSALVAGGIYGSSVSLAEERPCYELRNGAVICAHDLTSKAAVPDAQVAHTVSTAVSSPQRLRSQSGKALETAETAPEAAEGLASPAQNPAYNQKREDKLEQENKIIVPVTPKASPPKAPSVKVVKQEVAKRQLSPLEMVVATYTPEIKEYRDMVRRTVGLQGMGIFDRVMSSVSDKGKYCLEADERSYAAIYLTNTALSGEDLQELTNAEKQLQILTRGGTLVGVTVADAPFGSIGFLLEKIAPTQVTNYWDRLLRKFGAEAGSLFTELTDLYDDNPIAGWGIARKMAELSNHRSWSQIEAGFNAFTDLGVVEALDSYKSTEWPLYRAVIDTLLATASAIASSSDTGSSAVPDIADCLTSYEASSDTARKIVNSLRVIATASSSPNGFKNTLSKLTAITDAARCLEKMAEEDSAGTLADTLNIAISTRKYTLFSRELYGACPPQEKAESHREIKSEF